MLLHHLFLRSLIRLSFARMPSSLAQTYLGSLLRNGYRSTQLGVRRTFGLALRTTSTSNINININSHRNYTSLTPRSPPRYRVQPNHLTQQTEWQATTSSERPPQPRSSPQNDSQKREKFGRRRRKDEGSDLGAQGGFMGMSWKASLSLFLFLPLLPNSSLSSSPSLSFSLSVSDYDYDYDYESDDFPLALGNAS